MARQQAATQQHSPVRQQQQPPREPPQPPDTEEMVARIESAIEKHGVHRLVGLSPIAQIVKLAEGMKALRAALPNSFVETTILPLQGSQLGFLTDRDGKGGYETSVVKDVVVEAMMRGFNVVGNEFNIISGKFYGAKAGFERLVSTYPGLTDLDMQPGLPQVNKEMSGAAVPFVATWRLDGKKMEIRCENTKDGTDNRIPVKINAGMGPDAILGKAYRKMYFRIYKRLTGSAFGLVDGDATDGPIDTVGEAAPAAAPTAAVQSKATALDDMASHARERRQRASSPPPANDSDVSAELVYGEMAKASEAWRVTGSTEITGRWSQEQRRAAYAWALANNDTSIPDDQLPKRPGFTYLESEIAEQQQQQREPGEEG